MMMSPLQEIPRLLQIADRKHLDALDHRGFRRVRLGHQHAAPPAAFRFQRDGQHALHRPHRAIQPELADHAAVLRVERLGPAGGDHRQRDGQVERRSFLFQIRRCEVHRLDPVVQIERRGADGGNHPLRGFPNRRIRQADDDDDRLVRAAGVDLDLDFLGLDPAQRR